MSAVQQKLAYGSHFYGGQIWGVVFSPLVTLLFGATILGYRIASLSHGAARSGGKKMNPPRCAVSDIKRSPPTSVTPQSTVPTVKT